jgi:membrane protein YqaA with SNARE-associated domain
MLIHAAQQQVWVLVYGATRRRIYPFLIGMLALLLTLSMTLPFASVLALSVLLRRELWKEIVLLSSLGSATGGLLLYFLFHNLGWASVTEAYPDLIQSKAWIDATRWVSMYGTWALLGVAATPFPQSPALIFTAVSNLPAAEVFLALFFGKLLKYGVYAWLASTFPDWISNLIGHRSSMHSSPHD